MKNEKIYLLFKKNDNKTEPVLVDSAITEEGINRCLTDHIYAGSYCAEGSAEYLDRKKNYFIIEKEFKI